MKAHKEWLTLHQEILSELPDEALPTFKHGAKNYTVPLPCGAKIQVLLETRAFYLKAFREGVPATSRTVTWNVHGGPNAAWVFAKAATCGTT